MQNNKLKEVGTILAVIIGCGLVAWGAIWIMTSGERKVASESSRKIAFSCTVDMATKFHIHPVLTILINGVRSEVPANIGISPTCMYPLHTHDNSGTLHIESPVVKDFTIGDFFAVWNQPFDKDHILTYTADKNSKISMTVNGKAVDTYENTILHDKDDIVIKYDSAKK